MQTPGTTSPSSLYVPPAPREPSERARELIFRYQGSQFAFLLGGVIFVALGGVLTAVFDWHLPEDVAISLSGHASTGRVVYTEVEQNVTINGRHPTLIQFRYDVDGREQMGSSNALDHDVIASAQRGTDVPIEVASLNPRWAHSRDDGVVPGAVRLPLGSSPSRDARTRGRCRRWSGRSSGR